MVFKFCNDEMGGGGLWWSWLPQSQDIGLACPDVLLKCYQGKFSATFSCCPDSFVGKENPSRDVIEGREILSQVF